MSRSPILFALDIEMHLHLEKRGFGNFRLLTPETPKIIERGWTHDIGNRKRGETNLFDDSSMNKDDNRVRLLAMSQKSRSSVEEVLFLLGMISYRTNNIYLTKVGRQLRSISSSMR